jgi:hypothetical protein
MEEAKDEEMEEVEEVEESNADCVDTILEEISASRSSVVEDIEAIVELEKLVVWTADVVVNLSSAKRVVDAAVAEDDVELQLDVLISGTTILGTSEKVAELVSTLDELDVAEGSSASVEINVEVDAVEY